MINPEIQAIIHRSDPQTCRESRRQEVTPKLLAAIQAVTRQEMK